MTRTIKSLGAALLALAVLGAATAGAASAHEWREAGASIGTPQAVVRTSTLTFLEAIPGFEAYEYRCNIHGEGVVKPGGLAEITKVTNTTGEKSISCTVLWGGGPHVSAVNIEAEGLPWKTTLATYESSGVQELFEESAKWLVTTQSAVFGKVSVKCHVATSAVLSNEISWVDAWFSRATSSSCSNALWKGTLYTEGVSEIKLTSGSALKVI